MRRYVRCKMNGATYFFTVVTYNRHPILNSDIAIECLRGAFKRVIEERPFKTIAVCVLPDHLHSVWEMPKGDNDFSTRWRLIKSYFTRSFIQRSGPTDRRSESRKHAREQTIWQRRFWERLVRDEEELQRCVDYVHFNPLKHGLVNRLADYPWSSFHRFVRQGVYEPDWGGEIHFSDTSKFGE